MIEALVYIFTIISTFNIDAITGKDLSIFGYTLLAWVLFPLYLVSFWSTAIYVLSPNKKLYKNLLLVVLVISIITGISSIYKGYSLIAGINASSLYILPITIFPVLSRSKIDIHIFIRLILYVSTMGGIIALLCAVGIINPGYVSSGLVRSAVIVDGGLGLLGLSVSSFQIMYPNKASNNFLNIIAFVSSLVIIITGQSRTRIFLACMVLLIINMFNLIKSKRAHGKPFKIIVILIFGSITGTILFPKMVAAFFYTIIYRFEMIGEDNATIYRTLERTQQLEIFKEYPILGGGWGALEKLSVFDTYGIAQKMQSHNMYSTILAMSGLIFFSIFIIWFLLITKEEILKLIKYRENTAKLSVILLTLIFVLGWTSAGFGKPSQILAIILVYLIVIERKKLSVG